MIELQKSMFGNYHSNNSVKKHQCMLRTSGWNFDEEQDINIVSKYLPIKYSLSTKGKKVMTLETSCVMQMFNVNTNETNTTLVSPDRV